jgi:hypothetical protein
MYELKKLSREAVDRALAKAERYRLLNEPWLAESICRDILETAPDNQQALITLILSLTDQFGTAAGVGFNEPRSLISKLHSKYDQAYYNGIVCERRAKVHFERPHPGSGQLAYDWYQEAMDWYEKADELHPSGNEDALLRWNTCARMLKKHPGIKEGPRDETQHMLE